MTRPGGASPPPGRRRWSVRTGGLGGIFGALLLVLLLGGCVVPARSDAAYSTDASMALESALSATRTAQLALDQWLDGKLPRTSADVVVTESEGAMGPIQTSFGGVDPPSRHVDALRDTVGQELSDAQDALSQARIALRRGDRSGVRQAVADLDKVSGTLEKTGAKVS